MVQGSKTEFSPSFIRQFFQPDRENKEGKNVYVSSVCADIIISKEHRTAEVIVYFSSIGENCGRNFSFKFKMQV